MIALNITMLEQRVTYTEIRIGIYEALNNIATSYVDHLSLIATPFVLQLLLGDLS